METAMLLGCLEGSGVLWDLIARSQLKVSIEFAIGLPCGLLVRVKEER